MTRRCQRFIVAFLMLLGAASWLSAAVRLPGILADGMVLQQGTRVHLWGWADPDEQVMVHFQRQTVTATAKDGVWELWLAPLTSGGPFPMTISGKDAGRFAFVSVHTGATPRELKMIGTDNTPGLRGGLTPESEEFAVKFVGAPAGTYTATLRIVTQAGNTGILSTGKPGEPLENLYYLDIPLKAVVGSKQ